MLGKFLEIDYIVVSFLKPLNSACFFIGNNELSSKQVGSQARHRVTRRLAWIQPVCIFLKHKCGSRTERVKDGSDQGSNLFAFLQKY